MRRETRAYVGFHPVVGVRRLNVEQQRQEHGEEHREGGAGQDEVTSQVLGVLDQGGGERPGRAVRCDEDGSAEHVGETLAFPLRHVKVQPPLRHGPSGEHSSPSLKLLQTWPGPKHATARCGSVR